MERINTYERWLESEGLPVIRDYSVGDLMDVKLKPWRRKGGRGAFIRLVGAAERSDAYLCEIPPGGTVIPQRHLFEEMIYILKGYGATTVWVEGGVKQTFEWQEGSLFAPPLNAWHQHFNGQSHEPATFLGVTRAPVYMNLFHDLDFIFANSFVFRQRFSGEEDYFAGRGTLLKQKDVFDNPKIWDSNFIPDCRSFALVDDPKRGGLSRNVFFDLSNGAMTAHISEFPAGTYMNAHYHGPGTHLICLSGRGYELMWPRKGGITAQGAERLRIDVGPYSLFAPPDLWFHQHFSTGTEPVRLLAFHDDRSKKFAGMAKDFGRAKDIREGGSQISYEDEDPAIRRLFKEELARTGAAWRMASYFPGE